MRGLILGVTLMLPTAVSAETDFIWSDETSAQCRAYFGASYLEKGAGRAPCGNGGCLLQLRDDLPHRNSGRLQCTAAVFPGGESTLSVRTRAAWTACITVDEQRGRLTRHPARTTG